ncbi:MAG: PAS domain S-box protein [Proteobacteria bacterium]|nr:PAS domain S-box protein [Pseudomonadota bacterium]
MNATIRAPDLQALIDALPHLVWVTRADGQAEYFNARWREYTGLSLEASLGDGWRAPIDADQLADLAAAWRANCERADEWQFIYRLRRHDGVYRWFEARARRVQLEGQAGLHWIGTSTDIDEQRRAVDTVRVQERRYRALIEYLPDAFFLHDEQGRILDVNRHASELIGRTRDELLTLRITDLDAQIDATALRAQWQVAVPGESWEAATLARRPDG